MRWKVSFAKWRPFCLGLNVINANWCCLSSIGPIRIIIKIISVKGKVSFMEMLLRLSSTRDLLSCTQGRWVNTLRLGQNYHHFTENIFKCIFSNEDVWISLKISLKFVPKTSINNIQAKPLSEPVLLISPTHKCVTGPQWVKAKALERYDGNSKYVILADISSILMNLPSVNIPGIQATDCQAIGHYLSQFWPRSMIPYGVNSSQRLQMYLFYETSII